MPPGAISPNPWLPCATSRGPISPPWTAMPCAGADMPGPWRHGGAIQAGALPPEAPLTPGTAMRIFTGAPMPPGADTVVLQEDVAVEGDIISLTGDGPGAQGRHVRQRASDFAAGQSPLLAAGTRLGPPQLALAALAGHGGFAVRARPRVAILSTGDELVAPGAPCPPGKLPASNASCCARWSRPPAASSVSEALIGDDLAALTAALAAHGDADIVVTSGGASVGDHDLVRPALEAAGGAIDFWRIAMRPGKPADRRPPRRSPSSRPARQSGLGHGHWRAVPAAAGPPSCRRRRSAARATHGPARRGHGASRQPCRTCPRAP